MDFEAFVNDLKAYGPSLKGVEVRQGGKLLGSYGDIHGKHPIRSATRSVLALAVGIAVDLGLIDLEASILEHMPASIVFDLSYEQFTTFSQITPDMLMSQSVSPLPLRPSGDDYVRFCLEQRIEDPARREYCPSDINAFLMGVALSDATGIDAWDFIRMMLLDPLGISNVRYKRSPEGYIYGADGIQMSAGDLSKIGSLYLNNGTYSGGRIVSEDFITRCTDARISDSGTEYGYFLTRRKYGYMLSSETAHGCLVVPSRDMVISLLTDTRNRSRFLTDSMEKNIIGMVE